MSEHLKAKVKTGRYKDKIVKITNVSERNFKQYAACILPNNEKVNLLASDLDVIQEVKKPKQLKKQAVNVNSYFGNSAGSSKNMKSARNQPTNKIIKKTVTRITMSICESCGSDYNKEARKGMGGKLTECEVCSEEIETKVTGTMIYGHKTGPAIEIKKEDEVLYEANGMVTRR